MVRSLVVLLGSLTASVVPRTVGAAFLLS